MDETTTLAATKTIADQNAGWSKVRWAARYLFESGHFDLAERGFERLVALGRADAEAITTLHQLYSDRGEFDRAALLISRLLDQRRSDLSPNEHLQWSAMLFDTVIADPASPDASNALLNLLQAAAQTGPDGWTVVLAPHRHETVAATMQDPAITLSAYEQYLYAPPETGLVTEALSHIEAFGCLHAADWERSRSAERLLHAFGQPEAAYRVETCRREVAPPPSPTAPDLTPVPSSLPSLGAIAIAGGHPALRSMARRDLASIGVGEVREIPPAWEATRDSRAVQATLAGSDLVVVVTRQIAHTTSDQVRTAAARYGIPIVEAETASVAGIRRAVERFATTAGRS